MRSFGEVLWWKTWLKPQWTSTSVSQSIPKGECYERNTFALEEHCLYHCQVFAVQWASVKSIWSQEVWVPRCGFPIPVSGCRGGTGETRSQGAVSTMGRNDPGDCVRGQLLYWSKKPAYSAHVGGGQKKGVHLICISGHGWRQVNTNESSI